MGRHRRQRWLKGFAVATGLILMLIGLRFALDPRSAARFFGVDVPWQPASLHLVVAVRDVWLGALLCLLALLSEWRAMALWLGLGALVCFADASIVAAATGWWSSMLFHAASGVFCAVLGHRCWQEGRRCAS